MPMQSSSSNAMKCIGCGTKTKKLDDINNGFVPLYEHKFWRRSLAKALNYSYGFILALNRNARICMKHFVDNDFDSNGELKIPTAVPCQLEKLFINRIGQFGKMMNWKSSGRF
jgi:hypothetical protein